MRTIYSAAKNVAPILVPLDKMFSTQIPYAQCGYSSYTTPSRRTVHNPCVLLRVQKLTSKLNAVKTQLCPDIFKYSNTTSHWSILKCSTHVTSNHAIAKS